MKRFLLVFMALFLTTGCINIREADKKDIIENAISSKYNMTNRNSRGYKYYLPSNLQVKRLNGKNELISDKYYEYYLYVDLVSYYNKVINVYEKDEKADYSEVLNNNDKFGYLNVYKKDDKFLIDSVYNYGRIEVLVKEKDINEAISNCLVILRTIQYNNDVIKVMMNNNELSSKEEIINIFGNKENDNHEYLKEDVYDDGEENLDPDVIK